MAKIPGVPTLEPVNQPTMSPQEAGRPGEAVSQLGEVSNDATLQQDNVLLFMKKAQQNVDETEFQNKAHALVLQYQEKLEKTTNSRDVPGVQKQAQDDLNALVMQRSKSPALVEIQQQAQGLLPELQHLGVMKTGDLQVKESAVESTIQKQTLLPQLVNAVRNGDKATEMFINGAIDHQYAQREAAGLISHADVEKEKLADQIQFRQQLNESYISSADPKERLASIQQLKTGGSGPLNLEGLAAGDIAALRTQAESKNRELNNLAEAGNLNNALNVIDNAFAAPEYKNNYEARLNSLQDGDWLTKHGIVAEDGTPDRAMAEKLIAETTRQRAEAEKVHDDHDAQVLPKIEDAIISNKMSRGQLDIAARQEGLSPRAYSAALAKWDENHRYNVQVAQQGRIIANQEKQEKSTEALAGVTQQIIFGGVPTRADILSIPGLSKSDQNTALQRAQKAREDPAYLQGASIIANAYPVDNSKTSKMSVAERNLHNEYINRTMIAYEQEINAHPDEDKSVIASNLVMPGIVRNAIQQKVPATMIPPPSTASRFSTGLHALSNLLVGGGASNKLEKGTDAAAAAANKVLSDPAKPSGWSIPSDAPPAPKEDGKVLKSNGQVIAKSKGGQWVSP